ncbi:hypothetical protein [Pararhizobium sp.]|uniref:hypothetical protein n=1 Tax=Pararhizobium sp. TaxID=1977563 RepID=UPI003BABA568
MAVNKINMNISRYGKPRRAERLACGGHLGPQGKGRLVLGLAIAPDGAVRGEPQSMARKGFNRRARYHRTYRTGAAFQWPQLPTAIKIRHGRQASGARPVDGLQKDFGSAEK